MKPDPNRKKPSYIKTDEYVHQQRTHDRTKSLERFLILFEQGLGKTKSSIDTGSYLTLADEINSILVLAPKGVHEQWSSKEYPKHSGVPFETCVWIAPSLQGVKKKKVITDFLKDAKKQERPFNLKVFCMNIESVRSDKGYKAAEYFLKNTNCLMILDEATAVKNPKAQQSKRIYKLGALAAYRRALTGTPINNSPLDLWGICKYLGPGLLPFPTFTAFKSRYAEIVQRTMGARSFQEIVAFQNLDELAEIMGKFSVRYTKEQCLDLPEKIFHERWVPMSPEQTKAYNEMKSELLTIVKNKEGIATQIYTTTVLAGLMKLQQIATGFIMATPDSPPISIPNARMEALDALYSEIQDKLIIWCAFKHNLHEVEGFLSEKYGPNSLVTYYSNTSTDDRARAVDRINDDPTCRFFIATNAASKGLTLTGASHAVYYSRNFKLEDRLQSLDRIHRIGQSKTCIYHDLVTPGTIDERILIRLSEKEDIANSVLTKIPELI
jgi:SNF2 family DNA or RNA helicase